MKKLIKNLYTRKVAGATERLNELKTVLGLLPANYITQALATAANDFLVASGSGVFVKKTLAETREILNYIYAEQEEISGGVGGTISITALLSFLNADSNGDDFTLADGSFVGQLKKLILRTDSSSGVGATVTANFPDAEMSVMSFENAGEYALLQWNGSVWVPLELGSVLNLTDAPSIASA